VRPLTNRSLIWIKRWLLGVTIACRNRDGDWSKDKVPPCPKKSMT
jgi:hypothetical protein